MYKGEIEEIRFSYKGFPCVVLMQAMGFRTGYVGLPKTHKLYGVHYGEINIGCHGGLTYSESYLVDQEDEETWWIGYDTGHCFDGLDFETAIRLFKNYPATIKQIKTIQKVHEDICYKDDCAVRSLEYCINECKSIVDQLEKKYGN